MRIYAGEPVIPIRTIVLFLYVFSPFFAQGETTTSSPNNMVQSSEGAHCQDIEKEFAHFLLESLEKAQSEIHTTEKCLSENIKGKFCVQEQKDFVQGLNTYRRETWKIKQHMLNTWLQKYSSYRENASRCLFLKKGKAQMHEQSFQLLAKKSDRHICREISTQWTAQIGEQSLSLIDKSFFPSDLDRNLLNKLKKIEQDPIVRRIGNRVLYSRVDEPSSSSRKSLHQASNTVKADLQKFKNYIAKLLKKEHRLYELYDFKSKYKEFTESLIEDERKYARAKNCRTNNSYLSNCMKWILHKSQKKRCSSRTLRFLNTIFPGFNLNYLFQRSKINHGAFAGALKSFKKANDDQNAIEHKIAFAWIEGVAAGASAARPTAKALSILGKKWSKKPQPGKLQLFKKQFSSLSPQQKSQILRQSLESTDQERISAAERVMKGLFGKNLTHDQKAAILRAHTIGTQEGRGITNITKDGQVVSTYTRKDKFNKGRVLMNPPSSLLRQEAQEILDRAIAGATPKKGISHRLDKTSPHYEFLNALGDTSTNRLSLYTKDHPNPVSLESIEPGETFTVLRGRNGRLFIMRESDLLDRSGVSRSLHDELKSRIDYTTRRHYRLENYQANAGTLRFNGDGTIDISGYHMNGRGDSSKRLERAIKSIFPKAKVETTKEPLEEISILARRQMILKKKNTVTIQPGQSKFLDFAKNDFMKPLTRRKLLFYTDEIATPKELKNMRPNESFTALVGDSGQVILGRDLRTSNPSSHSHTGTHQALNTLLDSSGLKAKLGLTSFKGKGGAVRFNNDGSIDVSGAHMQKLVGVHHPYSIWDDAAEGLGNAIKKIFPDAKVRVTTDPLSRVPIPGE